MASVIYKPIQGHPADVSSKLRKRVGQLARDVGEFKIGKTSNPPARASQPDYANAFDQMIVIYETPVADHAIEVERDLIDYFSVHYDNKNLRGGGGGPSGNAPHYVYIVRSKAFFSKVADFFK